MMHLFLLRSSFSALQAPAYPFVLLPALSIPPSPPLTYFRNLGISHITNSALTDTQWLQAGSPCQGWGPGNPLSSFAGTFCLLWHQLRALRIFRTSSLLVVVHLLILPSSDWLHALQISSCGLHMDDEAIRVAVGLRLGINLCQPHQCPCGTLVDARGTHGLAWLATTTSMT